MGDLGKLSRDLEERLESLDSYTQSVRLDRWVSITYTDKG